MVGQYKGRHQPSGIYNRRSGRPKKMEGDCWRGQFPNRALMEMGVRPTSQLQIMLDHKKSCLTNIFCWWYSRNNTSRPTNNITRTYLWTLCMLGQIFFSWNCFYIISPNPLRYTGCFLMTLHTIFSISKRDVNFNGTCVC